MDSFVSGYASHRRLKPLLIFRVEEDLPLIAMPRLLVNRHDPRLVPNAENFRSSNSSEQSAFGSPSDDLACDARGLEKVTSLSILDFSPERVASTIVDLWKDLASEDARQDFLRYQRGWISHVTLLGCFSSTGSAIIGRVIEVACCLDLHCQEHDLAVTIVKALNSKSVSRMTAWNFVQLSLKDKMKEILNGSLTISLHPSATFRAPRDLLLEYWILSRPYVNDRNLLEESFVVEPQNDTSDVETRINKLEALVVSMQRNDRDPSFPTDNTTSGADETISELSDPEDLDLPDSESSLFYSSDSESIENNDYNAVHDIARRTRERTVQRLENIKSSIHLKSKRHHQASTELGPTSIPTSRTVLRSIDPLDQRSIFGKESTTTRFNVGQTR
jgi:hypothetical protein